MHRLGREAQVDTDGNAAIDQEAYDGRRPAAALELDHVRALLHQEGGVAHCGLHGFLVAAERHVGDDPCRPVAADHAAGVVRHLLDGYGERARATLQDIAERIADQERVDARGIQDAGKCGVVAGQHGDLFAGGVHFAQPVQGDGLSIIHGLL